MSHPDENPEIVADLMGELVFPSGQTYEVGVSGLVNEDGKFGSKHLPEGPWRIIHFRLKGRTVWLRGYSSAFLFRVGASERPDAGVDLFPSMTGKHARDILKMVGIPSGTATPK